MTIKKVLYAALALSALAMTFVTTFAQDDPTPTQEGALVVAQATALPAGDVVIVSPVPATEAPVTEAPAPIVVVAPAPTTPSEPTWSILLSLVLALVVILQSFLLSGRVPVDKVTALITQVKPLVESTPTQLDDRLLDVLKTLVNSITVVKPDEDDEGDDDTPSWVQ